MQLSGKNVCPGFNHQHWIGKEGECVVSTLEAQLSATYVSTWEAHLVEGMEN